MLGKNPSLLGKSKVLNLMERGKGEGDLRIIWYLKKPRNKT